MLIAGVLLVLLLLSAGYWTGNERRPLDRNDMQRVRRYSERLHRESTHPFD